MSHHEDLARAGRVLREALTLLNSERERVERQYQGQVRDSLVAGSPEQTRIGLHGMVNAARKQLEAVAQYVGYIALGLEEDADRTRERAHYKLLLRGDMARMARPLGPDMVRALELLRGLNDFFTDGEDFAAEVDEALAAPQATYPPTDWDAYNREWKLKAQAKAGKV